jgi:hypothetical protein
VIRGVLMPQRDFEAITDGLSRSEDVRAKPVRRSENRDNDTTFLAASLLWKWIVP